MNNNQTRLTSKYQATVPQSVRQALRVAAGGLLTWHVVRTRAVVDVHHKFKSPVRFLTNQIRLPYDAVKLVRSIRHELA